MARLIRDFERRYRKQADRIRERVERLRHTRQRERLKAGSRRKAGAWALPAGARLPEIHSPAELEELLELAERPLLDADTVRGLREWGEMMRRTNRPVVGPQRRERERPPRRRQQAQRRQPNQQLDITRLMRQIEAHEGRRRQVYTDTRGNRTIGVGFNLARVGARQRIQGVGADFEDIRAGRATLTTAQIDTLLRQDVNNGIAAARRQVRNFDRLPITAREVAVDLVFNLGEDGFRGFRNLRNALQNRDGERAAMEMENSRWYRQVGNRARVMVGRIRDLADE